MPSALIDRLARELVGTLPAEQPAAIDAAGARFRAIVAQQAGNDLDEPQVVFMAQQATIEMLERTIELSRSALERLGISTGEQQ